MIERKTVLDQVEINRDGQVRIRIAFLLVEGDQELGVRYHRTAFDPGSNEAIVEEQCASINAQLLASGEEPVSEGDISRVKAYVTLTNEAPVA